MVYKPLAQSCENAVLLSAVGCVRRVGTAGTTRRTRQAAAAEEEARATPAGAAVKPAGSSGNEAPADAEAAELQPAPQGATPAEDGDVIDAKGTRSAAPSPHDVRDSVGAAEHLQAAEEPYLAPTTAAGEPGTAAPSPDDSQPAAAEAEGGDRAHPAAAGEGAGANLDQAQATAGTEAGMDQGMEEDIEVDFEEAQDVFETPSQQPRMMTPGTSFGTARQQPSAYKTGQEYLTGDFRSKSISIQRSPVKLAAEWEVQGGHVIYTAVRTRPANDHHVVRHSCLKLTVLTWCIIPEGML